MVNTDPLNQDRIIKAMADALPISPPAPEVIDKDVDIVGLLIHACMISYGFKVVSYNTGAGETKEIRSMKCTKCVY